jgi:hypothetical protein
MALALLLAACSRSPGGSDPGRSGRPRNVILICLDTVRADHLGVYGERRPTTPFLDELAQRSLLFTDASATAAWTKPSVPSFLTGTYPCQHGVYEGSANEEQGEVTDVLPADALTRRGLPAARLPHRGSSTTPSCARATASSRASTTTRRRAGRARCAGAASTGWTD